MVTIKTAKPTKKTSLSIATPAVVDRFCELKMWDEAHKADPRYEEMEDLKKALAKEADDVADAGATHVFVGDKFEAEYSAKPNSTDVHDMKTVHKFLGEAFYKVVTISSKAFNDYLNPEQREQVSTTKRSGSRRCTEVREKGKLTRGGPAPL